MTHEAKTKLICFNWKECDWSYLFFRHFCFPLSNFQRAKHAQENCRADKIGMFWRTIPVNGMRAIPFISGDKLFVLFRISKIDRNSFRYKKVIFYKSIQFFCLICRAIVQYTYKNMKFHETSNPVYVLTFFNAIRISSNVYFGYHAYFPYIPMPQVYQCPNNLNYFYLL